MGVKERKERDRQDKRELILQSAHKLFLNRSFDEISIRNIAESIEYSPATIYLYFKDKDEIFFALHTEAFKKFNSYLSQIITIKNPMERLIKLGEKYIEFTFAHPKYYDIMFIMNAPMNCDENSEDWQEGAKAHCFLESIVQECKSKGHFKTLDARILSFTIWSYMHGMCSLALRDRMKLYPESERESVRKKSFKQFANLLKSL
jgi:AcrR family transcriptional regulator